MKRILSSLALLGLAAPAVFGASLTTFRVCEEKRILKTSDGADAGHVEYIVIDPAEQRVVSAIVTGGVIGQKFVTVPFSTVEYSGGNEIVLQRIDRQRLVSAPVIEERILTSGAVIEPTIIQRSYTHFGIEQNNVAVERRDVNRSATTVDRSTSEINTPDRTRPGRAGADANVTTEAGRDAASSRQGADRDMKRSGPNAKKSSATDSTEPGANATTPGSTSTDKTTGDAANSTAADRKMKKDQEQAERKGDKSQEKADRKQDNEASKSDRKNGATTPSDDATPGASTRSSNPSTPGASGTPAKPETDATSSSGTGRSGATSGSTSTPNASGSTSSSGSSGAATSTKTPNASAAAEKPSSTTGASPEDSKKPADKDDRR